MKKIGKIALGIVIVLVSVLILVRFYFCIRYHSFYANASYETKIAGLADQLIVQGFTREDDYGVSLESGYMKDGSVSRIYVIDHESKKSSYVLLKDADGADYTGHGGGITAANGYVYLCGYDNDILVYSMQDILDASKSKGTYVTPVGSFETGTTTSCCFADENYLWVAEFYREENYPTDESHHLTCPNGEENKAIALCYSLDTGKDLGIDPVPVKALSLPGLVQGICVTESGKIAISCSYAIATSHLKLYELNSSADSEFTVVSRERENTVPLWYLCEENCVGDIENPPMSEDLDYVDQRVCIMYESATSKYIFGNLYDGMYVYSYPVE